MNKPVEEKVLLQATLCFLVKNGKVLLGKKMKKIGAGLWNGYGGGIEADETPERTAVRELQEESGGVDVAVGQLQKVAIVDFHNTKSDGGQFVCQVHVYLIRKWRGKPVPTDEMAEPTWFDINDLPAMMPADSVWVPPILHGQKIIAKAWYGPHQQTLLRPVEIKEVEAL